MSFLSEMRRALGPAPRKVARWDWIDPPAWVRPDSPLHVGYERAKALVTEGEVVWGFVAHADEALARPGSLDGSAAVVLGAPGVDAPPSALERTANRLAALRATAPRDPALAQVAAAFAQAATPQAAMDVPLAVSWGVPTRLAWILVRRAHLPGGVLVHGRLPLAVSADRRHVMLLPARLWGEGWVKAWTDLGAE